MTSFLFLFIFSFFYFFFFHGLCFHARLILFSIASVLSLAFGVGICLAFGFGFGIALAFTAGTFGRAPVTIAWLALNP